MKPVEAGQIRENPGGRRVLVMPSANPPRRARGKLWLTIQLNGRFPGEHFGVPEKELSRWPIIATLPAETPG